MASLASLALGYFNTRTYICDVDEGRALLRGSMRRGGRPLHLGPFLLQHTQHNTTHHHNNTTQQHALLSRCLDGKHEEAALACWVYLVLGASFSGLGDFAPGGLLGPRYGHVWLLYPLENEPVGAEEGEGGAGSF